MKTGLRTEIVASICLLLGAALLFAGFLLLKLTEQELLAQERQHARETLRLLQAVAGEPGSGPAPGIPRLEPLPRAFDRLPKVVAWRVLDGENRVLASFETADMPPFWPPTALLDDTEIHERLDYSSGWLPWQEDHRNFLDLTAAFPVAGQQTKLLQARFSLENLRERVHRAQRLIMVYVVIYGVVLALFGIYVLHRNVVGPVRRLQKATTEGATGRLSRVEIERGPGEIVELADSFNRMVSAVEQSRGETAAHIRSLETANRELQQARDELVRSAKMASVGHLAAGMAHEIGNPLAALVGYLGVLQQETDDPGLRDLVSRAQVETSRIDKLVRELLDYAAPSAGELEQVDPVQVLRETVRLLTHQGLCEDLVFADRCGEEIGPVRTDRHRLQQVWVNLLLNARDAMDGSGTITLDAAAEHELKIAISDQGPGIPAEVLGQIFEPFFTTKGPGRGRGLGLAVCQRIIGEAGGRIEVTTGPDGSTFTVCLPRDDEEEA